MNLTDEAYEILKKFSPKIRGFIISRALIEAERTGLIDFLLGKKTMSSYSQEITQKNIATSDKNNKDDDDEAILEL